MHLDKKDKYWLIPTIPLITILIFQWYRIITGVTPEPILWVVNFILIMINLFIFITLILKYSNGSILIVNLEFTEMFSRIKHWTLYLFLFSTLQSIIYFLFFMREKEMATIPLGIYNVALFFFSFNLMILNKKQ